MSPHVRQISERATLSTNIKPKCYVGLAHAPWAHGAHSTGDINLLPSLRVLFHELSSQLTRFHLLTYLIPVSASPRLMSRRCVAVLSASSLSAAAAAAALAVDELSAALLRRFVDDRRSTEKSARGIDDSRRNL